MLFETKFKKKKSSIDIRDMGKKDKLLHKQWQNKTIQHLS